MPITLEEMESLERVIWRTPTPYQPLDAFDGLRDALEYLSYYGCRHFVADNSFLNCLLNRIRDSVSSATSGPVYYRSYRVIPIGDLRVPKRFPLSLALYNQYNIPSSYPINITSFNIHPNHSTQEAARHSELYRNMSLAADAGVKHFVFNDETMIRVMELMPSTHTIGHTPHLFFRGLRVIHDHILRDYVPRNYEL